MLFLAEFPFKSIYVVLWNSAAGCFLGPTFLRVIDRERPVAELVVTRHAQIHTFFLKFLLATYISVREDCIILATISLIIRIVIIPTFATLGAGDIVTVARQEIRSCITPDKRRLSIVIAIVTTIVIIAAFIINGIARAPSYPTDNGASCAADLSAFIGEWVSVSVQAERADGHSHVLVEFSRK